MLPAETDLRVTPPPPFVGRGGFKLQHALDVFGLDVKGMVAADIGASTGGFTDCLLKRGASRVYAVDVGKGQLDWGLRNDARVVVMEGVNARFALPIEVRLDLATIDVAFISVRKVLIPILDILKPGGLIVVLLKPQFEALREEVGRGGVVVDSEVHARVIGRFTHWVTDAGIRLLGLTTSPVAGAAGNKEFLLLLGV
jgi:23S rRNA (cytidine1920-2'-O)/16S rRNA (cytidine1409-2'-O)-methyltransferase